MGKKENENDNHYLRNEVYSIGPALWPVNDWIWNCFACTAMYKKSDRIALCISALIHGLLLFVPLKETPIPLTESPYPTDAVSLIELPILPPLPVPAGSPAPVVPPAPPVPVVPSAPPAPVIPPASPAPVVPPAPLIATPEAPPADLLPPDIPNTETSDSPTEEPAPEVAPDIDLPSEEFSPETSNSSINQPEPETDLDADLPPEDPSPETRDSPIEEPVTEAVSDAGLPPEEPSTETVDSSIDDAKIAAEWENLVGYLQVQNQGFVYYDKLFDLFHTFGEPEQLNQFFDEEKDLKFDVSSFYHFPHQTPEQVFQIVVIPQISGNTGFDLQPQENIAVGLAYQLSQGAMLRYLIIVQLNEGSGSVLMLSDSLLGLES